MKISDIQFEKTEYKIKKLSNPEKKITSMAKVKALYFGANWAPTCKKFLEQLIEFYHKANALKDVNIEDNVEDKKNEGKEGKIKNFEICYFS
jgi:thiol-disulfide isomerase/thioredoxin